VGVLNLVPFRLIWGNDELKVGEKERFINSKMLKYIKFWKLGMLKDDMYLKVMGSYVKYWENILDLLLKPIPWHSFVLLEGFWPFNNWRANYEHASIPTVIDFDFEDPIIFPTCGPRSMRRSLNITTYTPLRDLFVGNFVLLWPANPIVYHVWMGRAKSDVVRDQENENYRKDYV
jgi:hypothetical protein